MALFEQCKVECPFQLYILFPGLVLLTSWKLGLFQNEYLHVSKSTLDLVFKCSLAQVSCSLCSEMMERDILAVHKGENCPQRIVTCEFCEFPLPAIDLAEHQVVAAVSYYPKHQRIILS